MNLTDSTAEAAFRQEIAAWLAANPPEAEPPAREDWFAWRRDWQRSLFAGGWCGVHWPTEYGGRGASVTESAIFFEELARAGAPLPASTLGLLLAGPTIMTWGTEEQKARFLPPILSADEIWCQGFSEPDAGSDLAALRTRAVHVDGGWAITGQKVWTSYARHADWCALVARTDPDERRHRGLTFFLVDMHQPGVTVRPLRELTGDAHFNEVFLDEAFVPDDAVLGPVGAGWKVGLTMLMNERSGLAFFWQVRLRQLCDGLIATVRERGLLDDPGVAARLGDLDVQIECLRLTAYRGLSRLARGEEPGPEGSMVKLMSSRANQELSQLAVDLLGPEALVAGAPWGYELLRARGNSIEGGTSEILKSILAERVLGLPRGR